MPDVNPPISVGAFRKDAHQHDGLRRWLVEAIGSGETLGLTTAVGSATIRVRTSPRIWAKPVPRDATDNGSLIG